VRLLLLLAVTACGDSHAMTDASEVPANGTLWLASYNSTRPHQYSGLASVQLPDAASCQSVETIAGCTFSMNCTDPFTPPAPVTAGTIRIAGTTPPITLTPTAAGYTPVATAAPLFTGGEQLQVSFDDGTTTSITAPSQPRLTSITPSDPVVLDRSHDVAMTWDGAGAGDIVFSFTEGIDEIDSLSCSFPAADGAASLPTAALEMLGATPTLYVAAQSRTSVQLGAIQLAVAGAFEGVLTDGSYAAMHVQFVP
jgi:hypothetical protein